MGKSTINGQFSIAMLNYQRVMIRHDTPHMIFHPRTRWCHPGLVSGVRHPKGEANLGEMGWKGHRSQMTSDHGISFLWMCKHRIKVHQSDTSGGQVARTSKSSLRPLDHSSQPSTICSKKNRLSSTWCSFIPACSQSLLVFRWSLRSTHQPPAQRMDNG